MMAKWTAVLSCIKELNELMMSLLGAILLRVESADIEQEGISVVASR